MATLMGSLSTEGAELYGAHVAFAFRGVAAAVWSFFLDWMLPPWLKGAYVAWEFVSTARAINQLLQTNHTKLRRLLYFAAWMATMGVLIHNAPARRVMLLHQGLIAQPVTLTTVWVQVLRCDGSLDAQLLLKWAAARYIAVFFYLSGLAGTHIRLVKSLLFYGGISLSLFLLGLNLLLRNIPSLSPRIWKGVLWLYTIIIPVWDSFDLMEATIVERIPKALQRWFSRYQQNQRSRKALSTYQHDPLLPGEIRLMRLKSQSWIFPSAVRAELFKVSTALVPDYEAVSYRWGSSKRTDEILLNGRRFAVTESALELLLSRRTIWRERTLWIDAISIDQSNEEEKATQVRIMGDIYRLAERVIAFPGGDWTARVAAPLIIEIFGYELQTELTSLQRSRVWIRESKTIKWQTMLDLFTNEYFNRGWIIQEVAVAKKVELYYGNMYIPWSVFSKVIDTIMVAHRSKELVVSREPGKSRLIKGSTLDNIGFMTSLRPDSLIEERFTLQPQFETLLMKTCSFGTADPRDRIFSLRGIAIDIEDDQLKPDYSVTPERLFEQVAGHVLFKTTHRSSHLLSLAGVGFRSDELRIPSWVPNFGETREFVPYSEVMKDSTNYQASGESIVAIRPGPLSGSISWSGVLCDQIRSMSAAGPFKFFTGQYPEPKTINTIHFSRVKINFVNAAINLINENNDLWSAEFDVIKERLWLALLADRTSRLLPGKLPFKDIFWHWLQYNELLSSFNDITEVRHSHLTEDVAQAIYDGSMASYDWGVINTLNGRVFAVTERGELALVPPKALPTDFIFIPYGSQVPMVIREKKENDTYELVGEAYLQGAMMGEMMEFSSTHEMTAIFV